MIFDYKSVSWLNSSVARGLAIVALKDSAILDESSHQHGAIPAQSTASASSETAL